MPEVETKAINLFVAKPVKIRVMHLFSELVNIYFDKIRRGKSQRNPTLSLGTMTYRHAQYFPKRRMGEYCTNCLCGEEAYSCKISYWKEMFIAHHGL